MRQYATPSAAPATPSRTPIAQRLWAPRWESVFVVIATIMFATNATEIFLTVDFTGDSIQVRLAYLLAYGIAGMLLLASRHVLATLLTTSPLLVAVLLVPPISILWSVLPTETLERSIAVLGTSAFGIYLGWRFTLGRIVFLLAIAMSIAMSLSLVAILAVPRIGIDPTGQWAGTWRGIHFHKNGLGSAAGLACILIGYAIADNRGRWRAAFCVGFLLAFLLLVGSNSTSSLVAAVAVGMLALWIRMLQTRPQEISVLTLIIGFTVVIALVQLLGAEFIESVLALFGKRTDLSSRVPLWGIVWTFIQDRFWLGYGFQAFWKPDTTAMRIIGEQLYFKPFYSHNGILETWLNGGLVLVLLFLGLLVVTITKSAILFTRWRGLAVSAFPLIFCGYFLTMNFAESTVLARNNMIWTLLVTVVVFTSKWVRLRVV